MAGCLLRTVGFALLAAVDSLPALIVASAATGFAGALFNPAVRLSRIRFRRTPDRGIAVFNIFYQAGILIGPLVGVAVMAVDFRLTSVVAAGVFALPTIVQILALPRDHTTRSPQSRPADPTDWRTVLANRRFVLFAAAMIGSYVLSFQVYLALPLHAAALTTGRSGDGARRRGVRRHRGDRRRRTIPDHVMVSETAGAQRVAFRSAWRS